MKTILEISANTENTSLRTIGEPKFQSGLIANFNCNLIQDKEYFESSMD
jgi:hypothetical protein